MCAFYCLPSSCVPNQKMCEFVGLFVILLYYFVTNAAAVCHSEFCEHDVNSTQLPDIPCQLRGLDMVQHPILDCANLKFDGLSHIQPKEDTSKFQLSAYVIDAPQHQQKQTAFNLSIIEIAFQKLTVRYQSLANEHVSACSHIQLFRNQLHLGPKELYLSCPFSDGFYEGTPYRLEYSPTGNNYIYSKKFVFNVPDHSLIGNNSDIKTYLPFIYVDVSDTLVLTVYIQQLPKIFNVTSYKIWLINNDTNSAISTSVASIDRTEHIQFNFTMSTGVHYFVVAALHPQCGKYGCVNSTSPLISIQQPFHRVLIMIISIIWIPPVILYAIYHLYKLYRKRGRSKRRARKLNCLLIYSPTHVVHETVITEFEKYMKSCSTNITIDTFDIANIAQKEREQWPLATFQSADVILVATSPLSNKTASIPYSNVENYIYHLFGEDISGKQKRYYILEFPYCKPVDIPGETQRFKTFSLPKDLLKLLIAIHGIEFTQLSTASKPLLDSIEIAELEILDGACIQKNTEETDDLLPSVVQKAQGASAQMPEGSSVSHPAAINVDELSLLNEIGEGGGKRESFSVKPPID